MGLVYGVMRVGVTLADIKRLLGTIPWLLEYIYTRDKSSTSNLLNLLFFSHFWAQMSTNVCLWWFMGLVYGIMRVGGPLGDILRLLSTIHWPLQHVYTWDKSLTSNLLILLFLSLFWTQISTNVCLWWPMGLVYGVRKVASTLGDIIKLLHTIHWPL